MKRYLRILLFFSSFFLFGQIYAQQLDSLKQLWEEIVDDSVRYARQTEAVWGFYDDYNYSQGKKLAESNLSTISARTFPTLYRKGLLQLVFIYAALGENDNFRKTWPRAMARYTTDKDTLGIVDLLDIRAGEYTKELRYDSAYVLYEEALYLAEAKDDWIGMNNVSNNQAIILAEQGLLLKAKDKFYQAALASIRAADTALVFIAYNNVARCFIEASILDSVQYYLDQATSWRGSDPTLEGGLYAEMKGRLEAAHGEYEKALNSFHQATPYMQDDFYSRIKIFAEIGKLHFKLQRYDSALVYLNQAIQTSERLNLNDVLRDAFPLRAKSYAALGDWEAAYEQADLALSVRDEYLQEEVQRQVAEMEAKHQVEKLRAETMKQEEKTQQRTLLASVIFCGLLLISFLYFLVTRRNQQILRLNQDLEGKVAERTQELADSNEKLKEYLQDLQMFTHITSHDLKEPLRNISGFSSLLGRRLKGSMTEDTETFLGMIKTNAIQMHSLIEGIQFYASMEPQRKGEVALEPVALTEVMQQVEKALASRIAESGAEVSYPDNLPTIRGVSYVMMVVLKNLVENGIKYNRSSPPRVTVRYEEQATMHCLIVADNGIGVAPDYQDQVFEMFKRLHSRQDFSGTGMGLSISRKLMRRFDGDITLNSEEGKGSTFIVSLPKSAPL